MQHAEDLLRQQYTFLRVSPDLERGHREVERHFAELCALPMDTLRRFEVNLGGWVKRDAAMEDENDDGLLIRGGEARPGGGTYDFKMIWHQRPGLIPHFDELGLLEECVELRRVCAAGYQVHRLYMHALLGLIDEIDAHTVLGPTGLADALVDYMDFLVLRLLRYTKTRSDDSMVVGQSHQDRDTITLHGYQSHGSIQCEIDGTMVDIKPPPDHLTVFTGMKTALLTGGELDIENRCVHGGVLPGLWHQGCITEADLGRTDARRVAVAFSHTDPVRLF